MQTTPTTWIGRHWLAIINSFLALYVFLPIIAPFLMGLGVTTPARFIYRIYTPTCHQLAFRSIFFGGEQFVYPREHAQTLTSITSFEEYAQHLEQFHDVSLEGLELDLMLAGRAFLGTEEMGFKTAICQRDLMIFGFMLLGGLLFGIMRTHWNIRPMPLLLFVLIGMTPIAFDGFSQLFSYYIPSLAFRESPPYMRIATGAWFGLCVAWLAFPRIGRTMR